MNLDLWPDGKVELFQALNNNLVNSYWEANLRSNFSKPGPNASSSEVNSFLTDKYVNKKWIDEDVKYDPVFMFENKRSKFERFVKRRLAAAGVSTGGAVESDDSDQPKKKPVKPQNV